MRLSITNNGGQLPLKSAAGQSKRYAFLPAPAAGRYMFQPY
jgi:hypothetical protein